MKERIAEDLRDLIGRTGTLYSNLADKYPMLLEEIERGLKESGAVVDDLRSNLGLQGRQSKLDRLFERARAVVSGAGKRFDEIHTKDSELLGSLNESIAGIESLDTNMASIRGSTEEMELISLNAMTVAIKAGKAGGAFSYITDELQRLSGRTIASTHDLADAGTGVGNLYRSFGKTLEETERKQQTVFQDFDRKLGGCFDTSRHDIGTILEILDSIHGTASEVRPALFDIMQEIQHQDIIRQSIDHVIFSMDELQEPEENGDDEFLLDELTFYRQLPDLCITLLDDIRTQIGDSASVFSDRTEVIRSRIDRVDEIHAGFQSDSVDASFDRSMRLLQEIIDGLAETIEMRERVTEQSSELLKEAEELEYLFKIFTSLVGRFHNINIAAKIEIAKQSALSSMQDTVEEMTIITASIEENVENALRTIRRFIKKTRKALKDYDALSDTSTNVTVHFREEIETIQSDLTSVRTALHASIGGFSVFSDTFVDLFRTADRDIGELRSLSDTINAIQSELRAIRDRSSDRMNDLLKAKNLDSWTIRNTRLQKIIERFTIFGHKKHAGEIGGFQVEEGVAEGDVTFF
jgi:uncharacterized protein YukE